ncbi:hypothetical protein ES708_33958 [subsurface metagenome]
MHKRFGLLRRLTLQDSIVRIFFERFAFHREWLIPFFRPTLHCTQNSGLRTYDKDPPSPGRIPLTGTPLYPLFAGGGIE